ncbi:hypothetical protein SY88_00820 [Clostridiales bacterium PH28_bin88]|nr:hypothetical protein SY88_00820 [Clostridiales bacterium PH28_bin88]
MTVLRNDNGFVMEIPTELRNKLKLKKGDTFLAEVTANQELLLKRIPDPFEECRGMWADREDMYDSRQYISDIRREWEGRSHV